mgnify:FL=1
MLGENALITDLELNKPGKSITLSLSNVEAGMMTLLIPRGLIIATNDNFRVLVSASPEDINSDARTFWAESETRVQTQYEIATSTS